MLLAFETVARTGSACMCDDSCKEIAFRDLAGGEAEQGLATLLDGMVNEYGSPSALAVAVGPGSFTGLRIGTVAARTLAWLENVPVHAVDSLAARAAQEGDGLWWVLVPLKRDTTFHGLFRVSQGRVETIWPTVAAADVALLQVEVFPAGAVAIGPALISKSGLAERWWPSITLGSSLALTARGVARIAGQVPAQSWHGVLPAYHQASAPELQREQVRRLKEQKLI